MTRAVVLLVALLFAVSIAGCARDPSDPVTKPGASSTAHTSHATSASTAPTGKAATESFDGPGLPTGWVAHNGNWSINNSKLEGEGDGRIGFSSLVNHGAGTFNVYTLEINFTMLSGEHPQGAGVVMNWKDEKNYQIIRYSISEQGWNLFTFVDGTRDKQNNATVPNSAAPDFGALVHLKVTQKDGIVTAYDGNAKVIEFTLRNTDSKIGFVGAFCRGDTLADFDDFSVKPTG